MQDNETQEGEATGNAAKFVIHTESKRFGGIENLRCEGPSCWRSGRRRSGWGVADAAGRPPGGSGGGEVVARSAVALLSSVSLSSQTLQPNYSINIALI